MTDLAAWLLEQITTDEQEARDRGADAMMGGRWKEYPPNAYNELQGLTLGVSRRVLAECDAKRRIVAAHRQRYPSPSSRDDKFCWTCSDYGYHAAVRWPCDTLRLLALPYADREGYDEGWRP